MQDNRNTAFGWILFSGIVALGFSSLSSKYFHGNGAEAPEKPGYFIDAPEEGGTEDTGPTIAQALAAGSADAGEKVFAKCTACHTVNSGGANGIGPNLYGVLGKGIGNHAPGFAYSSALSGHGGTWDYASMDAWLKSPKAFANGTKMSFAGLGKIEDRANVILYMMANGGGPPLPTPEAAEEPAAEPVDGAGVGPGAVEAAGAMGDEQPVPEAAPAT